MDVPPEHKLFAIDKALSSCVEFCADSPESGVAHKSVLVKIDRLLERRFEVTEAAKCQILQT